VLDAIDNGTFIAIDEFNKSLHPLIVRFLLQMIHDPRGSSGTAQLMVSSHNTWLMDLDLLRRDEIWLMELDQQRASRLSSLLQQSPRKHEKVAKNYLRGSFGAIPRISLEPWSVSRPEPD
jgi:AAA15 family ATPase/GTPase